MQVGGMVVVKQAPPTAKGFHFLMLEDEFGFINVIVRPKIYEQYCRLLRSTNLLLVQGNLQRESDVINVIAERFWALP